MFDIFFNTFRLRLNFLSIFHEITNNFIFNHIFYRIASFNFDAFYPVNSYSCRLDVLVVSLFIDTSFKHRFLPTALYNRVVCRANIFLLFLSLAAWLHSRPFLHICIVYNFSCK